MPMHKPRTVPENSLGINAGLGLADAKYLGTAARAYTLNRRALVLQGRLLRVLYLHFLAAFHTISLGHC